MFGRRPITHPRPTVPLFVRIDPELKQRLSRLAFKERRSEARLIEDALGGFLDKQTKCAKRAS